MPPSDTDGVLITADADQSASNSALPTRILWIFLLPPIVFIESRHEKIGFSHMRKQKRRSASR